MQRVDIVGKTFGRLTALEENGLRGGHIAWLCACQCGTKITVDGAMLRSGNTKSCGCINRDRLIKQNTTHGKGSTPEFSIWYNMIARCRYPKGRYACHQGRGIKVCKRWLLFENFYKDMGERPKGMSLDRIDNDGDYEPGNVRWASAKTQANNRRTNTIISFGGVTRTLSEWSDYTGVKVGTISSRLKDGWETGKALTLLPKK